GRVMAGGSVVVACAVSACVVGSHDLLGKPCPCLADYACDPSTNRCVRATSLVEAGQPPDSASGDAGVDSALSDAGDFCASYPDARLCDDVHDLPAVPAWSAVATGNGGSLALTTAAGEFQSPPSALSALANLDAGPTATAYVEKKLSGEVTDLFCRFALYVAN